MKMTDLLSLKFYPSTLNMSFPVPADDFCRTSDLIHIVLSVSKHNKGIICAFICTYKNNNLVFTPDMSERSEMRGMGSTFHLLCPRYSGTLTPSAPAAISL